MEAGSENAKITHFFRQEKLVGAGRVHDEGVGGHRGKRVASGLALVDSTNRSKSARREGLKDSTAGRAARAATAEDSKDEASATRVSGPTSVTTQPASFSIHEDAARPEASGSRTRPSRRTKAEPQQLGKMTELTEAAHPRRSARLRRSASEGLPVPPPGESRREQPRAPTRVPPRVPGHVPTRAPPPVPARDTQAKSVHVSAVAKPAPAPAAIGDDIIVVDCKESDLDIASEDELDAVPAPAHAEEPMDVATTAPGVEGGVGGGGSGGSDGTSEGSQMSTSTTSSLAVELPSTAETVSTALAASPMETGPVSRLPEGVVDIDSDLTGHMLEYTSDIYANMRIRETVDPVVNVFLERRRLTHEMREILVNWLVEVSEEYRLKSETLYASVAYLDRCLSRVTITRSTLQLLGCACMLVACKFLELERKRPGVDDFVDISDNTYTREQMMKMEFQVLEEMRYMLHIPVSIAYVPRLLKASLVKDADERVLCAYLLELTLQQFEFSRIMPSKLAAAALLAARDHGGYLPSEIWTPTLIFYGGYTSAELRPLANRMHALHATANDGEHTAVYYKYRSRRNIADRIAPFKPDGDA